MTVPDDTSCEPLALLECETQTLVLEAPVAGTRFWLVYASDRVPGRSTVSAWDARELGLGGWSLDVLHHFDADTGHLIRGDGSEVDVGEGVPGPTFGDGHVLVADELGSEVYVFNADGRHIRTYDALTRTVRTEFTYDETGRLLSVADSSGNSTTVERATDGSPSALIAPLGARTEVAVDDHSFLRRISDPLDRAIKFVSTDEGLVTELADPAEGTWRYTYDPAGRLASVTDPLGGRWALARTATGPVTRVQITSPVGAITTYEVAPDGAETRRTRSDPDGTTTTLRLATRRRMLELANGTRLEMAIASDPRWRMQAPTATRMVVTTPTGLTTAITTGLSVELNDPADQLSVKRLQESADWDGAGYTSTFDAATRRMTWTSPAGRTGQLTFDERGRISREEELGLAPTTYEYDDRGRLESISRGDGESARRTRFHYLESLGVVEIEDPVGQRSRLYYDRAGTLTRTEAADGRIVRMSTDVAGRRAAVTPPGRSSHLFAFDATGQVSDYSVARAGGAPQGIFGIAYRPDGQVDRVSLADDREIGVGYDVAARIARIALERGAIGIDYDAKTGDFAHISSPDGVGLEFGYDGVLPITTGWSGPVAGTVRRAFGEQFRLTSLGVQGSADLAYAYDPDGLVSRAGDLTIKRDPESGFPVSASLGRTESRWEYDHFGDLAAMTHSFDGKPILAISYRRDAIGRIVEITEVRDGRTTTWSYAYDASGRLIEVTRGGKAAYRYDYDENGNIVRATGPSGVVTATLDGRDRVIKLADSSYDYSASGDLRAVTSGSGTTRYRYDELGALVSVDLADGRTIDYAIDGLGRRVGKLVDGDRREGLLYRDGLRPIARLGSEGAVDETFVHAGDDTAPEYLLRDGRTYRVITDHLGSPRLVVDAESGEIAQELAYDPYGDVIRDTAPSFQPFGFGGGIYDHDTRLVRFGARDYDPTSFHWSSADEEVDLGYPNLYSYSGADPINLADPEGLDPIRPRGKGARFTADCFRFILGMYRVIHDPCPAVTFEARDDIVDVAEHAPSGRRLPGYDRLKWGRAGEGRWARGPGVPDLKEAARRSSRRNWIWRNLNRTSNEGRYGPVPRSSRGSGRLLPSVLPWVAYAEDARDVSFVACVINGTCDPGGGSISPTDPSLDDRLRQAWREECEWILKTARRAPAECASVWGDPHFRSGDGLVFDFNGVGEYVATRSLSGDFEVQVRFEPWVGSISGTTALAMRVGTHRISFYEGSPIELRVDGKRTELAHGIIRLGADGEVEARDGEYIVRWADESDIKVKPLFGRRIDFSVGLTELKFGAVKGLLGDFDGEPANDIRTSDGDVVGLTGERCVDHEPIHRTWAPSWRVTQETSLFDYDAGEDTTTFQDAAFPLGCATVNDLAANTRASAEASCRAAGVDDQPYLDACILDVGVTGDESIVSSTRTVAEAARPPEVAGETTFTTFDGLKYPLSVTGDYVFTRSADRAFEVQVRLEFDPSVPGGSVITTGTGARVGRHVVSVLSGEPATVEIDGRVIQVKDDPVGLAGGGRIEPRGSTFVIVWPSGAELQADGSDPRAIALKMTIPGGSGATLEGLLGSADGDRTNDLTARDGSVLAPGDDKDEVYRRRLNRIFAASWRVPGEDVLIK